MKRGPRPLTDRTQDYLDGLHAGAENGQCRIEELKAEIERLRAALQMIAGGYWGRMDVQEYARRALEGK